MAEDTETLAIVFFANPQSDRQEIVPFEAERWRMLLPSMVLRFPNGMETVSPTCHCATTELGTEEPINALYIRAGAGQVAMHDAQMSVQQSQFSKGGRLGGLKKSSGLPDWQPVCPARVALVAKPTWAGIKDQAPRLGLPFFIHPPDNFPPRQREQRFLSTIFGAQRSPIHPPENRGSVSCCSHLQESHCEISNLPPRSADDLLCSSLPVPFD